MVKNVSREFATMSDDERRKYARTEEGAAPDTPDELDFDNPRDADHMGKHHASQEEEVADPDNRDGTSALLDDEAHNQQVERKDRSTGGE